MSVLASEDEIEELASELLDVAKVAGVFNRDRSPAAVVRLSDENRPLLQTEGFDGFTLELWSQLGGNKRK